GGGQDERAAGEVRAGARAGARQLRSGARGAGPAHGPRGGGQGGGQGQGGARRDGGADQAGDRGDEDGVPPQHRGAARGAGHAHQDLSGPRARPRRRALRPDLPRRPPPRGRRAPVLPPAHLRGRLLPRPRRVPPRPQAREPAPRRGRQPQGRRFRAQRARWPRTPRRAAPHRVRHAGVRGPRGARREWLRRRQGRHLVLRCHPLRAPRRRPAVPGREPHVHVPQDAARRLPLPVVGLQGRPEVDRQAARPQPEQPHHDRQPRRVAVVQEDVAHSEPSLGARATSGRARQRRGQGRASGGAERLPPDLPLRGLRPVAAVRPGTVDGARGEGRRHAVRDAGAGERRDLAAGGPGDRRGHARDQERGARGAAGGRRARAQGAARGGRGVLQRGAVRAGGRRQEGRRRHDGVPVVLQRRAPAGAQGHRVGCR
ncbi:hypothetical protein CFC21_096244, partial [Triticum aestivum]